MCRPEKGSIPPGKSVSVAIVWGPKLGKKNEAEVILTIPGGVQKSFRLEGQLPENKVELNFYYTLLVVLITQLTYF